MDGYAQENRRLRHGRVFMRITVRPAPDMEADQRGLFPRLWKQRRSVRSVGRARRPGIRDRLCAPAKRSRTAGAQARRPTASGGGALRLYGREFRLMPLTQVYSRSFSTRRAGQCGRPVSFHRSGPPGAATAALLACFSTGRRRRVATGQRSRAEPVSSKEGRCRGLRGRHGPRRSAPSLQGACRSRPCHLGQAQRAASAARRNGEASTPAEARKRRKGRARRSSRQEPAPRRQAGCPRR